MLEAQLLLCHAAGIERTELILRPERLIEAPAYEALVRRRAAHEPFEYLTGKAGFYSREFLTAPGVLIPRPETELLIDQAIAALEGVANPRVAEIGTGSGVIAVMIALLRPDARIIATDINPKALALAARNAERFGVSASIDFVETSLLEGVNQRLDLLVSNPPYIAANYPLSPEVLKEPAEALFGGERGDELLLQIIDLADERGIRALACESGYDQRESLRARLETKSWTKIDFYNDYAGLQRGFVARRDD